MYVAVQVRKQTTLSRSKLIGVSMCNGVQVSHEPSKPDYTPENKLHFCNKDILVSDFDGFISLTPVIEDIATKN